MGQARPLDLRHAYHEGLGRGCQVSDYDAAFAAATGAANGSATSASKAEGNPYDQIMAGLMSDAPASAQPTPAASPKAGRNFSLKGEGYDRLMGYSPRDAIGGSVRGAGSIGSTLIRPFESAEDNAQRRTGIDQSLTSLIGSDPESMAYKTNKLGVEIAGTAGIGGLLAKGIALIPGAAKALPTLLPAIQTGGMTANGATGVYGMANRVAGGAVNGAATAGLVDPKDADTGAMFGGATPVVLKTAGMAGRAIGDAVGSKPVNPVLQKTAKESIDAGYVIPPNMVKPSLANQVIESISGKQATQQVASTRNTEVTAKLVRQSLGIADDVPLTQGTLESLRKTAGKTYGEVSALSPQAAADLEALKVARNDAQGWFKAYNRSARPDDLVKAKEARALSDQLEATLEAHAVAASRPELIPSLRDARKQIAKTYTVGRALNDASGTVDARVFGRMHEKGLPLSDGLDVAGKFASAFPTIAKSPQQVGSPAAHNLKAMASLMMSGAGAGAGALAGLGAVGTGGASLAIGSLPFLAPPLARSLMFREGAQRGLLDSGRGAGLLSQSLEDALPLVYRTNPLLATAGQ